MLCVRACTLKINSEILCHLKLFCNSYITIESYGFTERTCMIAINQIYIQLNDLSM